MKNKKINFINIIVSIFLLTFGFFCFILEHPNKFFKNGISFISWFAYIPILFLIKRTTLKTSWLYGILYGFLCGFFFYDWLKNYDQYGIYAITIYLVFIMAVFFTVLKIVELLFYEYCWLVQWLLIIAFEYMQTLGFLGLNFGVTAYSQWHNTLLIQICDIIGVFGLNSLIILSSCCIFALLQKTLDKKKIIYKMETDNEFYECETHINFVSEYDKQLKKVSLTPPLIIIGVLFLSLVGIMIYGKIKLSKRETYKTVKIAAIQNNANPYETGISVYTKNVQKLMNITDSVLELNSDIDFVVWPETAVVPSILYQYATRKDESRYKLVTSVLQFIRDRNSIFIIGNGNTVVNEITAEKENFNSALIFDSEKNLFPPQPEIYSKIHLVPFSEYFPYKKLFPRFAAWIEKIEPNMWTPGEQLKVFEYRGLNFSTPICFEDNFTDICRKMYKNGARCFISLSNDSWSKSESCQYSHLAMAVFRSVENRVPSVRCTASGQTCIINSKGQIEQMAPAFTETYIVGNVPVIPKDKAGTIYNRFGDVLGIAPCVIFLFLLLIKIIIVIIKSKIFEAVRKKWQNSVKKEM